MPYPEFLKSCIHERASGSDGSVLELTFEYAGLEGHAIWLVIRRWYKTPSGAISEAVAVNRDGVLDMAATLLKKPDAMREATDYLTSAKRMLATKPAARVLGSSSSGSACVCSRCSRRERG